MKKIVFLLSLVIIISYTSLLTSAEMLSPGMEILKNRFSMAKSSTEYSNIVFTIEDFEKAVGSKSVNRITVTSLPSKDAGTLWLGGLEVMKNQVIGRTNIEMLRFVPVKGKITEADATFTVSTADNEYSINCSLYMLNETNYAPCSVYGEYSNRQETYKNVMTVGYMSTQDNESDTLCYNIIEYPKKGALIQSDPYSSEYCYYPQKDYVGEDSFTFIATDRYGNESKEITVELIVKKQRSNIYMSDLHNNNENSAAIEMTESGLMETNNDMFEPNKPMTRCEFLTLCMNARGFEHLKDAKGCTTVFEDESDIPKECLGYVSEAYSKGLINGIIKGDSLLFNPNEAISKSEAAIMIVNTFELNETQARSVFADETDIPFWGEKEIYMLDSLGLINQDEDNNIKADQILTRIEAAAIISRLI